MQGYQGLQSKIQSGLQNNINDPWTAMQGNAQLAQGNTSTFNQSPTSETAYSMSARGINPNSPLFQRQILNAGNATRQAQAGNLSSLLLQAGQLSQSSAIAASQYQPLQTGSTQTSGNSGLGSYV